MVRNQAVIWSNKGLLRDPIHLKKSEEKYWRELNEKLGIFCLTGEKRNLFMWKKYSNNLNGFCVGFYPKILFQFLGGGGLVHYVKTLPNINPLEPIHTQHWKTIFCKLKKWSFEKEYRTLLFWFNQASRDDRRVKVPKSAFAEIIIGENMSSKIKSQIIDDAKSIDAAIKIFIAVKEGSIIRIKSN